MSLTQPRLDSGFVARALGEALLEHRGPKRTFNRAVIDSRLVQPGDLFVGLSGDRYDGDQFAGEAAAAGATGLLLSRTSIRDGDYKDSSRFYVEDTLAALQDVAVAWRHALSGTTVTGITGNVGKTTTKLILAALLKTRYRVQASTRNYNNEIGVPLCLLELQPETERAVIEMGMYTTGEIALLCEWTRPNIGVVLNVGPVHLEHAGSMSAIVEAKRELVESLPEYGHAVLNADDTDVLSMAQSTRARAWLFGEQATAGVRGTDVTSLGVDGFEFTLIMNEAGVTESRRVRIPLPGTHLLSNVLAAAAAGLADDLTFDQVIDALEQLDIPLRLRVRYLPQEITLLDDTYNASPASTLAALDLLSEMPGRRRIALLGDMLELGDLADELHDQVGKRSSEVLDVLYTVGTLAERISLSAHERGGTRTQHLRSKEDAVRVLRHELQSGDLLLVKGSRSLELETVVRELAPSDGDVT